MPPTDAPRALKDTWWNRNKGVLLGSGLLVATTAAVVLGYANHDKTKFIESKGLMDEYLGPND